MITDAVLVGLLAAALALGLRAVALRRARRGRDAFVDAPLLARMVSFPGMGSAWSAAVLVAAAAAALAAVAAGASPGGAPEVFDDDTGEGPETVLVLDASNSMRARDVEPSRLAREREIARRLVLRLPGRVGIVYFAGHGYVLSPLTTDRDALLLFVEEVDPTAVGTGGTVLAAGLEQAIGLLTGDAPEQRQAVVILSDGEATAGELATGDLAIGGPEQPAEDSPRMSELLAGAEERGIRIYTVGIGTEEGARIPLPTDGEWPVSRGMPGGAVGDARPQGDASGSYLRDAAGRLVVTELHEASLQALARAGEGVYVRGTPGEVERLMNEIAAGRGRTAREAGARGILLLIAFALLWGEAYIFRHG